MPGCRKNLLHIFVQALPRGTVVFILVLTRCWAKRPVSEQNVIVLVFVNHLVLTEEPG